MKLSLVVLRALPLTFAVYVVNAVFAIAISTSLGMELEGALGFPLGRAAARVAAHESVLQLTPLLRAKAIDALIACVVLLLLSPWLHMAWLTSLSALQGPGGALRSAWSLYLRASVVTLLLAVIGALALLPWGGLAYAVHAFCEDRVNDRVHDLSVAIAVSPALLSLFATACWHDLARARCLSTGAFRSVLWSALDALRPTVLGRYAFWSGTGIALVVLAQVWAVATHPTGGFIGSLLLLLLLQGAAFARALLRSAWLAEALARVDVAPHRAKRKA